MSQQNVELVQAAYAAFARHDTEGLFRIFDPNIVFNLAENSPYDAGRPLLGQQEIAEKLFARIPQDTDHFAIVTEAFHDAGDVVVVQGRYKGRNRNTGLDLDVQLCHIWTVQNGRLTRMDQYLDTLRSSQVFGRGGRTAVSA
jgi:ketosteroid isomerase-like protein